YRHPPSLTLFPYTTLFRSRAVGNGDADDVFRRDARAECDAGALRRSRRDAVVVDQLVACRVVVLLRVREDLAGDRDHAAVRLRGDRKSTRLNSSHSQISYA